MRVHLDATVLTRDGEDVGSVRRAVVNPETKRVTDLVIGTGGLLGREVLLPCEEIDRASRDGEAVRLRLTRAEIELLPSYVPDDFVVPPAGWAYTGAYGFGPYAGYVWPAAYAGYVPPAAWRRGLPDHTAEPSIAKGAAVLDRDRHDVGVVDEVLFERGTGRLQGFVLRVGGVWRTLFGGGTHVVVRGPAIERVSEGAVYLRLTGEQLGHVAHAHR
jgi:sporulation protein YlmC with PRC-barrel domain